MNTSHNADHALSALETVRLVAGREIAERLHSRLIWITTALTTLLVVALIVIPSLVRQATPHTVVGTDQGARAVAALAGGFLLLATLGMYGQAVATGVAQEKTSRMAEMLLAAVRPAHLLTGKVVGIGVCGLAQLAVPVASGLIANAVVQSAAIPSSVWVLLPAALLWFVLGYALYAFGYAAAGALVGRQEEVQFVIVPLALPMAGGWLLTFATIAAPDAWWLRLLALLPPLAPVLMPVRLALGAVTAWEMAVAVLLTLLAVYGMVRLAARIYAPALVRGGVRLSWRAALRLQEG